MFRWVIAGDLARDCQPGCSKGHTLPMAMGELEGWIQTAKRAKIQSLLCLLSQVQLTCYAPAQIDFLAYYRQQGLHVLHIPVNNPKKPHFSEEPLKQIWEASLRLPKPLLVYGDARRSLPKQAVAYILQCRARSPL